MPLLKHTYALPPEVVERFEQAMSAGERSAMIAELLQEWLDEQRRQQLRREVIEGCVEMADVYLEIEREYHPLEEEVLRALDRQSQTGRHRARASRPRRRV